MAIVKYVAARWGEDSSMTLVYDDQTGEITDMDVVNNEDYKVFFKITDTQNQKTVSKEQVKGDSPKEPIQSKDAPVISDKLGGFSRQGQRLRIEMETRR